MIFDAVLGNDHIKHAFCDALRQERLPKTILITGPCGIGKFTMAKALAKASLCCDKQNLACGRCSSCKKIEGGGHPDLTVVDMQGKEITVDVARRIKASCSLSPNEGDLAIYIIRDIQNLNVSCANALLKILEEPPGHVLFILTCDYVKNVLSTIVSRCVQFCMQPLEDSMILKEIEKSFPEHSQDDIKKTVRFCQGIWGRAKEYQKIYEYKRYIEDFVHALLDKNQLLILEASIAMEKMSRDDMCLFAQGLNLVMHDALMDICSQGRHKTEFLGHCSLGAAKNLSKEQIILIYKLMCDIIDKCQLNANMMLLCAYLSCRSYEIIAI